MGKKGTQPMEENTTTQPSYQAKIAETGKQLTLNAQIAFSTGVDSMPLYDEGAEPGTKTLIEVTNYVKLMVHNEHSDEKDYVEYYLIDKDDRIYKTCSESFFSRFMTIWGLAAIDNGMEVVNIAVYKAKSKNGSNKDFLTCSFVG